MRPLVSSSRVMFALCRQRASLLIEYVSFSGVDVVEKARSMCFEVEVGCEHVILLVCSESIGESIWCLFGGVLFVWRRSFLWWFWFVVLC